MVLVYVERRVFDILLFICRPCNIMQDSHRSGRPFRRPGPGPMQVNNIKNNICCTTIVFGNSLKNLTQMLYIV